mmetsp:Transcript_26866/g.41186  ORF Transcript_26866/g.41186 Transcript_26866/m.41186 type:complete len:253 (+) Transcript_26866:134-892(+)
MFPTTLVVLAYVSAYAWAQFPYDNLCPTGEVGFEGKYSADSSMQSRVVSQTKSYSFCNQNFFRLEAFPYPPLPGKQPEDGVWMTDDQERITDIWGWTSVAVMVSFIMGVFGQSVWIGFRNIFQGIYKPEGREQHIDFGGVEEIFGYVPQIPVGGFPFPLLACDIDDVDQNLVGWNDRQNSYDIHNLIFDVPYAGMRRTKRIEENTRGTPTLKENSAYLLNSQRSFPTEQGLDNPIFSIVKQYPVMNPSDTTT